MDRVARFPVKHYYPNFDEFCQLADQGNTIPVYRQLLADALTPGVPPTSGWRIPPGFAPAANAFLLESVVGGEQVARYSFVAADPEITFTARRDEHHHPPARRQGRADRPAHDPLGEIAEAAGGLPARARCPTCRASPAAWSATPATTWSATTSGWAKAPPTTATCPTCASACTARWSSSTTSPRPSRWSATPTSPTTPARPTARPPRPSSGPSTACARARARPSARSP